jgi:hypothetical protein
MSGPSRELFNRLADEFEQAGASNLIPPNDANAIAESLRGRGRAGRSSARIYIPSVVECKLSNELQSFEYFRCNKCHKVENLKEQPVYLSNFKCRCGGSLIPAPIWVITAAQDWAPPIYIEVGARNIAFTLPITSVHQRAQGVVVNDKARPLQTMEVVVGESRSENLRTITRRGSNTYLVDFSPTEAITKPVSITAFNAREQKPIEVPEKLPGVKGIFFSEKLEVLQATAGFRVGHSNVSNRSKRFVFELRSEDGSKVYKLYGRYLVTKGIIVEADKDAILSVCGALRSAYENAVFTALHTISHCFLSPLPRITGLEGGDFAEALSSKNWMIAVYDNCPGGLGGVEGLIDDGGRLKPNYYFAVREQVNCPLACYKACKACLFSDSCFMLNWNLDRRILRALGWGVF